jgi:exodeoxyribonuclease VII large subunit
MAERRSELRSAARALPGPEDLLAVARQRFDAASERLPRGLRSNAHIHHMQFSRVAGRLAPPLLRSAIERRRERLEGVNRRLETALKANRAAHLHQIARQRERVNGFGERGTRAIRHIIARRDVRTERAAQLLTAFSYRGVLGRGFALVRDMTGKPVRVATAVKAGMRLDIEFVDGRVSAIAEDTRTSKPGTRRGGQGGDGGQGSLFGT